MLLIPPDVTLASIAHFESNSMGPGDFSEMNPRKPTAGFLTTPPQCSPAVSGGRDKVGKWVCAHHLQLLGIFMTLSFFSLAFNGITCCSVCYEMAVFFLHRGNTNQIFSFECFFHFLISCLCCFLQLHVDRTRPEKMVK